MHWKLNTKNFFRLHYNDDCIDSKMDQNNI